MSHIDLAVNIKTRPRLMVKLTFCQHFSSIEGLAHGDGLEMFDIIFEKDLIIERGEDGATESLYFDHF